VTVAAERAANRAFELALSGDGNQRVSFRELSWKNSGRCSGWRRPLAKQPVTKAGV
jgi:hypothetical protein